MLRRTLARHHKTLTKCPTGVNWKKEPVWKASMLSLAIAPTIERATVSAISGGAIKGALWISYLPPRGDTLSAFADQLLVGGMYGGLLGGLALPLIVHGANSNKVVYNIVAISGIAITTYSIFECFVKG